MSAAPARWIIAAALAVLLATAPVAPAQDPELSYDEDSPAGQEYVIPLESARSSDGRSGDGGPDLFGDGITRPGTPEGAGATGAAPSRPSGEPGASSGPRSNRNQGEKTTRESGDPSTPRGDDDQDSPRNEVALASAGDGRSSGPSGALVAGGSGLMVLLLSFVLAAVLRRRDQLPS